MENNLEIMGKLKKILSVQFFTEHMGPLEHCKYLLYQFFIYCNMIAVAAAGFAEDGVLNMMYVLINAYVCFEVTAAFIPCYVHRKKYFNTMTDLQQYYNLHKSNETDRLIISSCQADANKITNIYGTILVSCMIFLIINPILAYAYSFYTGSEAILELPSKAIYPWGQDTTFKFILSYVTQSLCITMLTPQTINNMALPVNFCMAIVYKFRISQERFIEIKTTSDHDESLVLLRKAILSHQEALELLKKVQMMSNKHYFFMILIAGLAFSISLFLLTAATEIAKKFMYTQITISMSYHTFILCYYGQKVKTEIENLITEIYNVPWYNYSIKHRRLLIICLARAQRTESVTAWPDAEVSLETYMNYVSSAYTYLAFLETMAE